ncbi:MAG: hypothetical protein KatS3mg102_0138 [Planctomycetota bacterium]|nr:MAG: hypothetical protein KatS3mg102_0138 [Planctomycetota bacterium]
MALGRGDLEVAAEGFAHLVHLVPGDAEALAALADLAAWRGQPQQEARWRRELLARGIEPASNARRLAELYLGDVEPDAQGLALLEGFVQAHPEQLQTRALLARVQLAAGRAAPALAHAAALATARPDGTEEQRLLVEALLAAGQRAEAERRLAALIRRWWQQPQLLRYAARLALEHGAEPVALAAWARLAEADPGDAEAAGWAGRLAVWSGRYELAVPWLERAVRARPRDGELVLLSGEALAAAAPEHPAAQRRFRRAYELLRSDEHPEHALLRARAALRIGRTAEALAQLERLRRERGPEPWLELLYGRALLQAGAHQAARAAAGRALELVAAGGTEQTAAAGGEPARARAAARTEALLLMADAAWSRGELPAARDLYAALSDAEPDNLTLRRNHAELLRLTGRWPEALAAYRELVVRERRGRLGPPRRAPAAPPPAAGSPTHPGRATGGAGASGGSGQAPPSGASGSAPATERQREPGPQGEPAADPQARRAGGGTAGGAGALLVPAEREPSPAEPAAAARPWDRSDLEPLLPVGPAYVPAARAQRRSGAQPFGLSYEEQALAELRRAYGAALGLHSRWLKIDDEQALELSVRAERQLARRWRTELQAGWLRLRGEVPALARTLRDGRFVHLGITLARRPAGSPPRLELEPGADLWTGEPGGTALSPRLRARLLLGERLVLAAEGQWNALWTSPVEAVAFGGRTSHVRAEASYTRPARPLELAELRAAFTWRTFRIDGDRVPGGRRDGFDREPALELGAVLRLLEGPLQLDLRYAFRWSEHGGSDADRALVPLIERSTAHVFTLAAEAALTDTVRASAYGWVAEDPARDLRLVRGEAWGVGGSMVLELGQRLRLEASYGFAAESLAAVSGELHELGAALWYHF